MNKNQFITIQGWMRTELNLKGNDLLVYAIIYGFSQTENQKFTGSLQYLADWCGATKQGILKNLKNLVELGLIVKEETGVLNSVAYYSTEFNSHSTEFNGAVKLSLTNNIDTNNIDNTNTVFNKLNTTTEQTFLGSAKKQKQSKPSMYTKCSNIINEFTNDAITRDLLFQFLNMLIESSKETGSPLYSNVFKGKVNMLKQFPQSQWKRIIQQTLDMGWKGFYALKSNNNFSQSATVNSEHETEEDIKKREEFLARKRANGERTQF